MALGRGQLVVGAVLDDAAVLDDDDLVGHAHGREAVRDQDRDAVLRQPAEVLEDRRFGGRVHRRGRFIQHQDVRARTHEGARQGDLLPLPTGQRSEEHTSELQSLMRISYAVFCLKKKKFISFFSYFFFFFFLFSFFSFFFFFFFFFFSFLSFYLYFFFFLIFS